MVAWRLIYNMICEQRIMCLEKVQTKLERMEYKKSNTCKLSNGTIESTFQLNRALYRVMGALVNLT